MTNVLNAKITAAAKAAAKLDDAKVTLRDTAADLLAADVTPARISRDGDLLAQFQEVTAAAIFTKPDLAMWADTSLAISTSEKVNGKRKQTNTPRGLLVNRVNSVIRNIRKAMEEVIADPKARGPKEKSTPTQAFFKAIDGYVERFAKDDASDTFDFDCVTARAALVAMLAKLR
jgi:glutamyl/glutaminyl-tRNA synthetase